MLEKVRKPNWVAQAELLELKRLGQPPREKKGVSEETHSLLALLFAVQSCPSWC